MKYLKKNLLIVVFFLNTAAFAQIKIKDDTRKFLIPHVDSLEKFIQLNKIDYALVTYSTSNWIGFDYIFYAVVRKKKAYYLMRWANLDYFRKNAKLKINQKKLIVSEAEKLLKEIAPDEIFKFSDMDYRKLPSNCTVIQGTDTLIQGGIYDINTLHVFEHIKNAKKHIGVYAPHFYLENCYPYNPEYGILKGFVNAYDKLTQLVKSAFKDDLIPPIYDRSRLK